MERQISMNPKRDLRKRRLNFENFYAYLIMALPLLIVYLIFFFIPSISSFFISFTNYNGISLDFDMVGLKNYQTMLQDQVFRASFTNTFVFTIVVSLLQNLLSLLTALGLNARIRMRGAIRTMIFAPVLINAVVTAYIWTYIFDTNGLINTLLRAVGLGGLAQTWLGNPDYALGCVIVAHVWRFIGYSALIYLANLQSISSDVLEAAEIDGAVGWKRFRYVVFPLLAPATTINIITSIAGTFKVFDIIFAMTEGGPGNATETIATYIVRNMNENLYGYAAAISIALFFIILVINVFVYGFLKKRETQV